MTKTSPARLVLHLFSLARSADVVCANRAGSIMVSAHGSEGKRQDKAEVEMLGLCRPNNVALSRPY